MEKYVMFSKITDIKISRFIHMVYKTYGSQKEEESQTRLSFFTSESQHQEKLDKW